MAYRVAHCPTVPGRIFTAPSDGSTYSTAAEAKQVQDALADYDLHLLNRDLRLDFSNASWIEEWNAQEDDWEEMLDEDVDSRIEQERGEL